MENISLVINSANGSMIAEENDTSTQDIVIKCLSVFLLIGIIVLNTIVIVLLFRRRQKSRMGFFVLNLAISDVCVGIFFVLPETVFINFHVRWTEGLCMAYYIYFSMMAYYVSTYAIVIMSLDRLYVISRPLSTASRTSWYKYSLALSAWIIGGLLAIQYAVHGEYDQKNLYCYHNFNGPKYPTYMHMMWFDLVVFLIIPITVIVICYGIIIIKIHERDTKGFINTRNSSGNKHEFSTGHKNISTAKMKTIKLLFLVVIAYILSWAPITIDVFLLRYNVISLSFLTTVLYTLAPLNSLTNPLVFLLFNRKMFRQKKKKETTSTTMNTKLDSSTLEQVVLISSSK